MMNFAASLYRRVNVKELLTNAPVYGSVTGSHFDIPSFMFLLTCPICMLKCARLVGLL